MIKMRRVVTTLAVTAMCLLAPMQNVAAAESDNGGTQGDGQTYTQNYTLEVQSEDTVLGASYRTDFSKEIDAEKITDVKFYKVGDKLAMICKVDLGTDSYSNSTLYGMSWRDTDGKSYKTTSSTYTRLDGENKLTWGVLFDDDVKAGDKVVLYSYMSPYNTETNTWDYYAKEIVKFVTVSEAEEWKGQAYYQSVYAGNNVSDYSINAVIPGDTEVSDSAYLALYSGDKLVARSSDVYKDSVSDSIYLDGVRLHNDSTGSRGISGTVYAAKALAAGKYTVKLIDGDKVYDLGERFTVSDEKSISSASRSYSYASSSPVVRIYTNGYTGDEILVEIVDKDGKVIATSDGGDYMLDSSDTLQYKLKSDYKLDDSNQMSDLNIVIKSLDGTELYKDTYYNGRGIVQMYYDYYDDCVYARAYGISDGTVVTANLYAGHGSYAAEGVVNDGRVLFYFTENGQKLDLTTKISEGKSSEYFSVELHWDKAAYESTVNVQDNNRTGTNTFNISRIESWYPIGTTSVTADVDISKNSLKTVELQEGTTYTFKVSTSDYFSGSSASDKSDEINAAVTQITKSYSTGDVAGLNFKADIPVEALEAGYYYVVLSSKNSSTYGGTTTYRRGYGFGVADYNYMYSSMGSAGFVGDDTPYIYMDVPEYMRATADPSKMTLSITDVLGNPTDVQITYDSRSASNSTWYFKVTGADPEVNYYITASYDGNPVYSTDDAGLKRQSYAAYIGKITKDTAYFSATSREGKETSEYYKLTSYIDGAKLEIREAGKFDVLRTMDIKKGYNYFTEDFLAGLSYDKLQFKYEVRVIDADGKYVTGATGYLASSDKAYEPFDKDEDNDTDTKLSGIVLAEDGNYYYYVDGAVATSFTGLAANDMGTFYFVNGKLDFSFNGFVYQNDTWWCVAGGRVCPDYTGLWSDAAVGWWYVKDGKIDFSFNGLVPFGDAWWCVAGGRVCFDYTGLWSDANVGWWYVENGAINFGFNGYVPFADVWWCVAGGRVCFDYTGLWSDANVGWWYTENGAINFGFNGLVPFGDAWWCVAGGRVAFEYTGLWYDANVGWWYVENGVINFGFSGAVDYNGGTYNVVGGMVVFG